MNSEKREEHESRWARQRETPYSALSEAEKESDRVEARKSIAVLRDHLRGNSSKTAYERGVRYALTKHGLDEIMSAPDSVAYQRPTTSPHGRGDLISQAFQTNAELGQPDGELASATNPSLEPGLPASPRGLPRHFTIGTDSMGDALSQPALGDI